jgi:MSHA pilin protein MshC
MGEEVLCDRSIEVVTDGGVMKVILNKNTGFTLVELIVVIVILGILSAVAAPKFFDQQSYRERAFKDELVSALRYAQKRAVASGCAVRVGITATDFTLYRHADTTSCNTLPPVTVVLTHPSGGNFTEEAPITLTPVTLAFDALGRTRNASYTISDLTNVAGLAITIDGETGCVTQ